jgi:hypothetical protein
MVGGVAAVLGALGTRRTAGLAAVLAALIAWEAGAGALPDVGRWTGVLVVALVVVPLTFAVPWLVLPTAGMRGLVLIAVALGVLAVLLDLAGMGSLFNVTKLLALTAAGFLFLRLFEALSWVVLVALVIPWVDALSVWRGPTDYVVSEQPSLFDHVSVSFRLPGNGGSAEIGPPDILFFALFLATADRFGLRVRATWLTMVALLAATLILTNATDINGLPALPAIAIGFLLPNADLLWKAWRQRGLEVR